MCVCMYLYYLQTGCDSAVAPLELLSSFLSTICVLTSPQYQDEVYNQTQ